MSERFAALGSMVYMSRSLRVFERFSDNGMLFVFPSATHAYSDSSTLSLLVVGSSPTRCSFVSDIAGLAERSRVPVLAALLAAISSSESWLSMVAMNDSKAASDRSWPRPQFSVHGPVLTSPGLNWFKTGLDRFFC